MIKKVKKIILNSLQNVEDFILSFNKHRYLKSERIPWTVGYSEYKYDSIGDFINSKELAAFTNRLLPAGYGYRLDERAVEYPWFFSRLKDTERTILDAGSVLNHRQILSAEKLKGRNLYISTLFYEVRPAITPSPSYIYEDLRDMCFRDDFLDAICCLSTLEHVGMDNTKLYTPDNSKNENNQDSYLIVISEFNRVLKPGGTLYLSIPFGVNKNHGWLQVFDSAMLNRIIEEFAPLSFSKTFFRYENDQWNFSTEDTCQDGYCFDIHENKVYEKDFLAFARCVVCVELIKGEKPI